MKSESELPLPPDSQNKALSELEPHIQTINEALFFIEDTESLINRLLDKKNHIQYDSQNKRIF